MKLKPFTNLRDFVFSDSLSSRILFFFFCIVLIAFREIDFLIHPRLWGEEGKFFYSFARHHSLFEILTTVQVGYVTLFNSMVSAIQAKLVEPENVPIVSTYLGFIIQLLPVYILTFTAISFFTFPLNRLLSLLSILYTVPELWLNSTNTHFVLGLCVFLISLVSTDQLSGFKKNMFRLLLVLGPLSGPSSMLILPVFYLKYFMEKTKERFIQVIILTGASLVQLGVTAYSILYNNQFNRLHSNKLEETLKHFMMDHFSLNIKILDPTTAICFGSLVAVCFLFLSIKNRKSKEQLLLTFSFILMAVLSSLGSLKMEGSPRYGFIPTFILMMILMKEFEVWIKSKNLLNDVGAAFFVFSLSLNIVFYHSRMEDVRNPSYPIWTEEIKIWRKDNSYAPKIHPSYENYWYVNM